MFFMLFQVGFTSVMLRALKLIMFETLQNMSFAAFSAMSWTAPNSGQGGPKQIPTPRRAAEELVPEAWDLGTGLAQ